MTTRQDSIYPGPVLRKGDFALAAFCLRRYWTLTVTDIVERPY